MGDFETRVVPSSACPAGPVEATLNLAKPSRRCRRRVVVPIAALLVGAIAIVAFLPIVNNGFVDQWDDQTNFLENANLRSLGWPQLRWASTTVLQGAYQPLAWILMEAEFACWGLDPKGYHLTSLVMHAIDSVLFFLLVETLVLRSLRDVDRDRKWMVSLVAGVVAALFAAHPLRVEVVAWASCQPYLPCAGFAMLSVLAYLHSVGGPRRSPGWMLASVLCFAASLLCKAVAVCLPLVFLILDVAVLRRAGSWRLARRLLLEKLTFAVPAVAVAVVAYKAKSDPPPGPDLDTGRLAVERMATAAYGLAYYPWKTVWPTGLSAYHFRPERINVTEPRFAVSLTAVAALCVASYGLRKTRPGVPAGLLASAILLAPTLGLISYGITIVSDRYSYIGTMPLYVLLASAITRRIALVRRPRVSALATSLIGLFLVGVLTTLSWAQCRTWRDSDALRLQALRVGSGRDALLESNLGIDLFSGGHIEEGMAHLRKAVQIDPLDPGAHENLGVALHRRGELAASIAEFSEAVRLAPGRVQARHHLGLALALSGRHSTLR